LFADYFSALPHNNLQKQSGSLRRVTAGMNCR